MATSGKYGRSILFSEQVARAADPEKWRREPSHMTGGRREGLHTGVDIQNHRNYTLRLARPG